MQENDKLLYFLVELSSKDVCQSRFSEKGGRLDRVGKNRGMRL